jgi:type I restriction enzyme, S subunit
MSWPTVRTKYVFRNKNVRGADAPLASATQNGVELRDRLGQSVWNPGDDVSNFKLVQPGEFVIGLRSFQHGISFSDVRGLVSPAYTVFDAWIEIDPRYYKYYFRSSALISRLENISQGIRQGRTIDTEEFFKLPLPVPPLEEQRRIADFLEAETARIDKLVRLGERALALAGDRRGAVVDKELASWEAVPVTSVCHRILDCVNKTAPVVSDETPYRMIRTSNVRRGKVDVDDTYRVTEDTFHRWNRRGAPLPGDILFTRQAPVGEAGMLRSTSPVFLGQQVMLYRANEKKVLPELLLYNFLSSSMRRQFDLASDGAAHAHMRVHECLKLKVVVPPSLLEQERVAKEIRRGMEFSDRLESTVTRQIELLKERRQALITAAVTGEFDVSAASGRGIEE